MCCVKSGGSSGALQMCCTGRWEVGVDAYQSIVSLWWICEVSVVCMALEYFCPSNWNGGYCHPPKIQWIPVSAGGDRDDDGLGIRKYWVEVVFQCLLPHCVRWMPQLIYTSCGCGCCRCRSHCIFAACVCFEVEVSLYGFAQWGHKEYLWFIRQHKLEYQNSSWGDKVANRLKCTWTSSLRENNDMFYRNTKVPPHSYANVKSVMRFETPANSTDSLTADLL